MKRHEDSFGETRIVFANQLRGLAALMVVASHLIGVSILMGPFINWDTSTPPCHIGRPLYLTLSIIGFSVMIFVIKVLHLPYAAALACGFTSGLLLARPLHNLVERPSNVFGKRLAQNLAQRCPPIRSHAAII